MGTKCFTHRFYNISYIINRLKTCLNNLDPVTHISAANTVWLPKLLVTQQNTIGVVSSAIWELGDKCFANTKTRIHLSGDPRLKNGQVSNLCTKAPDNIKEKFAKLKLERQKRIDKQHREMTRKRDIDLIHSNPSSPVNKRRKSKQITLPFTSSQTLSDREVDNSWGLTCFGLDIPPNKLNDPLCRDAFHTTQNSSKRLVIYMIFFIYITLFLYICIS